MSKKSGILIAACAAALLAISACSKGGSENAASEATAAATAAGPVTDSAENGLKKTETGEKEEKGDPAHGKQIFAQNCASCHGANAQGGVGPNLHGEKKRKDYQQTIAWIKDPKPPMPKLYPTPLSEGDVADVAAYVQTL